MTLVKVYCNPESLYKDEGRAHETEELDLSSEMKEYECTCHVYGQTHKYKEKQAQTPYYWEDEAPVHLSRLWTDTQVEIRKPNGQN